MEYLPLTDDYKLRCISKIAEKYDIDILLLKASIESIVVDYSAVLSFEELLASIVVIYKTFEQNYPLEKISHTLVNIFYKLSDTSIVSSLQAADIKSVETLDEIYSTSSIEQKRRIDALLGGTLSVLMLRGLFADQTKKDSIFYSILTTCSAEPI